MAGPIVAIYLGKIGITKRHVLVGLPKYTKFLAKYLGFIFKSDDADYDLMLELTRLGTEGVTPAAKLIAIEMMKGNTNGFK